MKKKKRWITGFLTGMLLSVQLTGTCYAGFLKNVTNPDLITLRSGVEYSGFDVTGDGKTDKVMVKNRSGSGLFTASQNGLQIYINGTEVFDFSDPYYRGDVTSHFEVKLCTVASDKIYFFIRTESEKGYYNFCRLYECKNGRMQMVLDLKKVYENLFHYRERIEVSSVGNNSIWFQWYGQLGAVGGLNWTVKYVCTGNCLRPAGSVCPVLCEEAEKLRTAARDFSVYATCSLNEEYFRVNSGEKVKITCVYNDSERFYIQMENPQGLVGWMPCPNNEVPYFEEAFYV